MGKALIWSLLWTALGVATLVLYAIKPHVILLMASGIPLAFASLNIAQGFAVIRKK